MAGRERGGGRAGSKSKKTAPRHPTVRVQTAKGRKPSSTRWLQRQLNDPYVIDAGVNGYRSRAAWKLLEIDQRFGLLRVGFTVVDLGAAPGGWTQVAVERVRSPAGAGRVLAVDLSAVEPIYGAEILQLDLDAEPDVARLITEVADGCDLVVSDMAIAATGHRPTDQIRNQRLAEIAYDLASRILKPRGGLVVKTFHGGGAGGLMAALKRDFTHVKTFKPPASRSGSAEIYVIAQGYRA